MLTRSLWTACVTVALLGSACDDPKSDGDGKSSAAAAAAELEPGKTAASLRLEAVVELVQGDSVADAKALEAKINDPKAKLNAVDIDEDGKTDFVEVIERHEGDKTVLVLRAIPSSKPDEDAAKVGVEVATVTLKLENDTQIVVEGTYTDHIDHDATIHVYHHEHPVVVEGGVVVVDEGCFFHYAFVLEHEVYLGHHHGLVIIETSHHHYKHKKHKKHGKHKGHGHGHGHGHTISW